MFNIRGSDISFNPVAFAGALLTPDNAFLFIDKQKFGEDVEQVKDNPARNKPFFNRPFSSYMTAAVRSVNPLLLENEFHTNFN